MNRVVITGMGIVSSLGGNKAEVLESLKSAKTHPQNAPTIKTCKKTLSGRGQTSKIDDSYTLSAVFSKPRAPKREPKWSQNGASGHPKSQKTRKESTPKNLKNTTVF